MKYIVVVDILRHQRVSQGRGDDRMNWMARPELSIVAHLHICKFGKQSKRISPTILCAPLVTSMPISERRLCSEWATSAAKILRQTRGKRVPEAGTSRSEAEITHSPEFSPDARCEFTRENIAYTTETSPQVRIHVVNPLLSTVW
jgi:hypothetical protein